jgi:hypothetical protein
MRLRSQRSAPVIAAPHRDRHRSDHLNACKTRPAPYHSAQPSRLGPTRPITQILSRSAQRSGGSCLVEFRLMRRRQCTHGIAARRWRPRGSIASPSRPALGRHGSAPRGHPRRCLGVDRPERRHQRGCCGAWAGTRGGAGRRPTQQPTPVSRAAGSEDSAAGNGGSGSQRAEAADQADQGDGKADKNRKGRHDKPGKGKDKPGKGK